MNEKILCPILFIRFFIPTVGLTIDRDVDINIVKNIPEYKEYTRKASEINTTNLEKQLESAQELIQAEFPPPFNHLSSSILCKEKPAEGNLFGHIYCWSMIILFILLIGSLIIYQLRSIFWFKANISGINSNTNSHQNIELGSRIYGQRAN